MTTMTAFDQNGDGEDNRFGSSTLKDMESYAEARNRNISTALENPPYLPYQSEREPIEVFDEAYFATRGSSGMLWDDPYEEAAFKPKEKLSPIERVVPGAKIARMTHKRGSFRFMG